MSSVRMALAMAVAVGLVLAALAGHAQRPARLPRVEVLLNRRPALMSQAAAFESTLRDLGHIAGHTITIHRRYSDEYDEFPRLAAESVADKPDVIVAYGTAAVMAVTRATTTIPIVMVAVGDPIGSGFVTSLAQPGGNITGVTILHGELAGKRLELLREVLPARRHVAVLWHSNNPGNASIVKATQEAASALGFTVRLVEVRNVADLPRALDAARSARPEALVPIPDGMFSGHRKTIIAFALQQHLPLISANREWPDDGALLSYGPDFREHWRRAAAFVDKILKGARPGDLPVEQPTKFELIINMKTARLLGLTIAPSLLLRADEIIP